MLGGTRVSFSTTVVADATPAADGATERIHRPKMTERSFLIRPTEANRESYLEALREGFNQTLDAAPTDEQIAAIEADFAGYLRGLNRDGQTPTAFAGRTLPGVPANTFWLEDRDSFVGSVNIRARIDTEILAHFSGHLGFGVRPSLRRRGYGTRQLALALEICRGMGVGVARLSCAEANVGSRRVIKSNGGLLLRRCAPNWFVERPYLLYEIPLI